MSDNTTPKPMRIALANLTPEHYSALERAMSNILSTALTSETFAQIVDGLPTRDVHQGYYGSYRDDYHGSLEPSQLAMGVVQAYREGFSIGVLQINAKEPIYLPCHLRKLPQATGMLSTARLPNYIKTP
jgi:hypothetical protein